MCHVVARGTRLLWTRSYLTNLESVRKLPIVECEVCESGDNWFKLIAITLEEIRAYVQFSARLWSGLYKEFYLSFFVICHTPTWIMIINTEKSVLKHHNKFAEPAFAVAGISYMEQLT